MQPLFTVHAGEFLVGEFIERNFRNTYLWVPSKDTGIDLLVTDKKCQQPVSLQVKYSRDYLATHLTSDSKTIKAFGWWTIDMSKLAKSSADYWVFLLAGEQKRRDYVVVPRTELLRRLRAIHPNNARLQTYLWVTEDDNCWETRGLSKPQKRQIADGTFHDAQRDFTAYLNNWSALHSINETRDR